MYFGSLIIPAIYFLITRWHGETKRPMLVGVGLQFFWSLAVWAYVYVSWHLGYNDSWMGWGLLLPVNIVGFFYYVVILLFHGVKSCRNK